MWISVEDFKPLANMYLLQGLIKGIPSLFVDLKPLYHDIQKRLAVEELVEGYRQVLEEGRFPDETSDVIAARSDSDAPAMYLWTLYFLAQHFSHTNRHSRALSLLSTAITHTPTLPELHTLRGRVLKRLGDPHGASAAVDEARLLDGQDRFLNTKSAKYKLRAGLIEEASDIFGLFTKVLSCVPWISVIDAVCLSPERRCQPRRRLGRDAVPPISYRGGRCTQTSRQAASCP
jgi:hypothetical protein